MGIKVEEINGGEGRKVLEDFKCNDGEIITKDFEFDGASVPRAFSWIVARFKYLSLSGRHDWDCEKVRSVQRQANNFKEIGDTVGYKNLMRKAKMMRSDADKRYGKGLSKKDNTVSGHVAWAGVRVGSWLGIGW